MYFIEIYVASNFGDFLENDFWTPPRQEGRALGPHGQFFLCFIYKISVQMVCPSVRFLDPSLQAPLLSILYMTKLVKFYLLLFRLDLDIFWAERCGHGLG